MQVTLLFSCSSIRKHVSLNHVSVRCQVPGQLGSQQRDPRETRSRDVAFWHPTDHFTKDLVFARYSYPMDCSGQMSGVPCCSGGCPQEVELGNSQCCFFLFPLQILHLHPMLLAMVIVVLAHAGPTTTAPEGSRFRTAAAEATEGLGVGRSHPADCHSSCDPGGQMKSSKSSMLLRPDASRGLAFASFFGHVWPVGLGGKRE